VAQGVEISPQLSKQSRRAALMLANFSDTSAERSRRSSRGLHFLKFWRGHFQTLGPSRGIQSRLTTQDARLLAHIEAVQFTIETWGC